MNDKPYRHSNGQYENVLSAWQAELTKAVKERSLDKGRLDREGELWPQFLPHYTKLSALPRRVRRAMQRQWKKSLAAIALLLALGAQPALAATINVGGACTLTRAISSANTNTPVGGCTVGSGADTIVLPRNSTHTLRRANNVRPLTEGFDANNPTYGPTSLPVVRSVITIVGNNSIIRRAPATPRFRILAIGERGNLTLRRTRVSGGVAAQKPNNRFSVSGYGGGVLNNGTLALTNGTISANRAAARVAV
jgi:hypothetical protein